MKAGEVSEKWTSKMSIEVTNIPKEKVTSIANEVGEILKREGIKFDYGGIGAGLTGDRICGIDFEVMEE
ncbi:hypothetical protein [Clostridium sp. FP1]|uniref:hypothetical protein n=1 Tax=Clostridium sp. FP1 TaxID=2724076 RepID=UPI0013E962A7|nr:hypothetical protein [Clostridium sp. FP1]MBZ9635614.1 hypothetical protein [Clostridium sp. FP1]